MNMIRNLLARWFNPVDRLPAGMYAYKTPPGASRTYRLHLRLELDGRGLLLVNAATVLHLNPTAAEYAYYLVHSTPAEQAAQQVASRYKVTPEQAGHDYAEFVRYVESLLDRPDLDPVSALDIDRRPPYSGSLSAPYRLDCALTYRWSSGALPNQSAELTTREWQIILDKAWEAGIPHVTFTGGEATLRPDLVDLLDHAEGLGMVTGLLTDGLRLADSAYLDSILQAGLDHAMIVLRPQWEETWESLVALTYWTDALEADLHLAAHLTLTSENAGRAPDLLERLAASEIHAVSLSASRPSLYEALQSAREHAARLNLSLIRDMPVPYSGANPLATENQADEAPPGAGRAWLYVEPDGDVRADQSAARVLGNFLRDPWEVIWNSSSR